MNGHTKTFTRSVVVRMEPTLDDWLQALSDEDGRTKSQTIRWLLNQCRTEGLPR